MYFRCLAVGTVTLDKESSGFAWLSPSEAVSRKPILGAAEAIRRLPASPPSG